MRPSRRSVLRGAAGAALAGIAATALAGSAAPALAAVASAGRARSTRRARRRHRRRNVVAVVVHVRYARSGEIDVFRGTSQTRVRDRELAARLVRASR